MTKPWEANKQTIIRLYHDRTLADVMKTMQQEYGFSASTRAYRQRLELWGVSKYKPRKNKSPKATGRAGFASPNPRASSSASPEHRGDDDDFSPAAASSPPHGHGHEGSVAASPYPSVCNPPDGHDAYSHAMGTSYGGCVSPIPAYAPPTALYPVAGPGSAPPTTCGLAPMPDYHSVPGAAEPDLYPHGPGDYTTVAPYYPPAPAAWPLVAPAFEPPALSVAAPPEPPAYFDAPPSSYAWGYPPRGATPDEPATDYRPPQA